ncbi:hypothetical protein COP1_006745 [Malus domestica]
MDVKSIIVLDILMLHVVCKLQMSLYCLKQAPRAWNERFTKFLLSLGFKFSYADPYLFVRHDGYSIVILLLYVDDIIPTGDNSDQIQYFMFLSCHNICFNESVVS